MLTEVSAAVGAHGGAARLFVRCERCEGATGERKKKLKSSSSSSAFRLRVAVVDGQRAFAASVTALDRPKALDCSPDAFLAAVEGAFKADRGENGRLGLRWEREKGALTLVERTAGLAMKFAALQFEEVDGPEEFWGELLHSVVDESAKGAREIERRESRVRELEALLRDKDALLDKAVEAKQRAENDLFEGFCAVLNAKKDEILRLQHELNVASARASEQQRVAGPKTKAAKKKAAAATKRPRATRGAKLKAKEEESEELDEASSSNEGECNEAESDSDDDDDERERKRTKREAINAYSQLPSGLRPATQRINSADDVLSDLDALMKSEVEANEAEQERKLPPNVPEPSKKTAKPAATKSRGAAKPRLTPVKAETMQSPPPKRTAKRAPPPRPIVDSDDEDILDILG